jgi:hypothetical protein
MIEIKTYKQTVDWLHRFGYLNGWQPTECEHDAAVAQMQKVYGLITDGVAGPLTRHAMGQCRCGCTDRQTIRVDDKHCKWKKQELTFAIQNRLALVGQDQITTAKIIRDGFKLYEPLTGLTFTETANWNSADIRIGKGAGRRYGFDGPGNILAWAEMPAWDDDVYLYSFFDASEPWNLRREGYGIIAAAVWQHELGHLLGLDHSENPGDLMAPIYNPQIIDPQAGDRLRLATVYGVSQTPQMPEPGIPVGSYHVSGMITVEDSGGIDLRLLAEK